MLLRRFVGILLAASTAHLGLAASDLACATHDLHPGAREAVPPMQGMHHGEADHPGKEGCRIPVSINCCEAMTSCAANVAMITVIAEPVARSVSPAGIAFVADAPLTRILPPDPPPPKA